MELWTQESLNTFCSPGKNNVGTTKSEIGHDGYIDFIDAAVETFGKFKVRSALIVGLNSKEEIKEAIDTLVSRGCYVTLSPFKAPEQIQKSVRYGNDLQQYEPSCEELIELSQYLSEAVDRYIATNSLTLDEIEELEENIDLSLNAHNTHNTANLCSNRALDRKEEEAYLKGVDEHIVTNIGDFKERDVSRSSIIAIACTARVGKIEEQVDTMHNAGINPPGNTCREDINL